MVEENKLLLEDIEEEIEEIQTIQENDNDNEMDDNQVGCPKCCFTFLHQEELDYHLRATHGNYSVLLFIIRFKARCVISALWLGW